MKRLSNTFLFLLALTFAVAACDDSTGTDGGGSSINGNWETEDRDFLVSIDVPETTSYEALSDTSGTCWVTNESRLRSFGDDLYTITEMNEEDADTDTLSISVEDDRLIVADADGSDPETYLRSDRSPSDLTPRCNF